ncbi:TraR/DksA family transcriptional regulator [Persicimonas caeni]|uniref:TraR/DksA family transcriptional regulator n=1 Tax=Persicimonas caeni TaxID=2292766 RepID=A0A4Y6PRQ3_PERCE|nr:TraR/DksA family transcriptional regulator [Persicimonas caeni]QDG50697.1 TraR/DksA family transcriptional regulator [Persicimonas caeni]QED31918.1 TraR/DksA family transcriptional regulator [Persicimonas caeni]
MEPEELEELREKLIVRRDELIGAGDVEFEPVKKDPSSKVDEDEAPLTEMNQVIASRRNKNRKLELERINVALQRIANNPDEFGECAACGEMIPIKRLELMPWARYCVACQEERSGPRGRRRRHLADFID